MISIIIVEDNGCMGVAEIIGSDGYSAEEDGRTAPMSEADIYVRTKNSAIFIISYFRFFS